MSTLWKWQEAVIGLLMIAAGVILLMMPELTMLLITQGIAAVLGVSGLVFIIVYFVRRRSGMIGYDLVKAAILLAAAIALYLHPETVIAFIPTLLGICILVSGILILQRSFDLLHFGGGMWVLLLITALLSIIVGILVILNPFSAAIWLTRLTAGGFILAGAIILLSAFLVAHRVSKTMAERERDKRPEKPYGENAYSYRPQEEAPAYPPQEAEPGYGLYGEEEYAPFQEDRPVETEIPNEADYDAGQTEKRGFFKRKKS